MSDTENKIVETPIAAEEVVNETVEAVVADTTEVMDETSEAIAEDANKKRKSFFDIFKRKSKKEDDEVEATEETIVEEDETPAEAGTEEATPPDVPVEKKCCKWKGICCAWCKPKKEEETPAAAEGEEAPAEEAVVPVEEVAAPVLVEEPVVEEEAVVAEEAAPVEPESEVEAVAEVVSEDVVISGSLFKAGRYLKRNFHERHCRLLKSGVVHTAKSADFAKAAEFILTGDSVFNEFHPEGADTLHKLRLEIHGKDEVLIVGTDSQELYDEWKRALETVIASLPKAEVAVGASEETVEAAE